MKDGCEKGNDFSPRLVCELLALVQMLLDTIHCAWESSTRLSPRSLLMGRFDIAIQYCRIFILPPIRVQNVFRDVYGDVFEEVNKKAKRTSITLDR